MKQLSILMLFSFFFIFLEGCISDEDPINNPLEESESKSLSDSLLIWERVKGLDSLQYSFVDPIYFNGTVIMHKNVALTTSVDDIIYALDAETGELLWEWSDWIEGFGSNRITAISQSSNELFFESNDRTYCINAFTGESKWRNNDDVDVSISGNFLSGWKEFASYITSRNSIIEDNESFYLHNLENNITTEIFNISNDALDPNLVVPNFELSENGDTIMYFCGTLFDSGNYDGINGTHSAVFMSAFNITRQEYIWRKDDVAFWNVVRKNAPIILDESVILTTHDKVISFDKNSGNIFWEVDFDLSLTSCNYLEGNGQIFVRDNFSNIYSIDAKSGQILWHNDTTSRSSFCSMSYFDNYLYVSTNNLDILDALTGEIVYTIEPHNKDLDNRSMFLFKKPALSEDGKLIYLSDTFFDICYTNPVYSQ